MSIINIYHGDSIKAMESMKENQYDLAIVDPPYGMHRKMDGGDGAGRIMRKFKRNKPTWDNKPDLEYFQMLQQISSNQIIWGGNNFIEYLYNTTGYIFWYKHQPAPNFADGEFAWTSFQMPAKCFNYMCYGAHGQDKNGKIHPTQKPVALYKWLLKNYGFNKDGSKRTIFDSHGGSMSHAIACIEMGFDLDIWELDKDYYDSAVKRIKQHVRQLDAFRPVPEINYMTS